MYAYHASSALTDCQSVSPTPANHLTNPGQEANQKATGQELRYMKPCHHSISSSTSSPRAFASHHFLGVLYCTSWRRFLRTSTHPHPVTLPYPQPCCLMSAASVPSLPSGSPLPLTAGTPHLRMDKTQQPSPLRTTNLNPNQALLSRRQER